MHKIKYLAGIAFMISLFISQVAISQNVQDYKKTESGIRYKFLRNSNSNVKVLENDELTISMVYKNQRDSVIFDSRKQNPPFTYNVSKPLYKGDFNEMMLTLKKGDSVTFVLKADSFFLKTLGMKKLPSYVKKGSELTFFAGIRNIRSAVEVLQEQAAFMKETNDRKARMIKQEKDTLDKYLLVHKIDKSPENGIYLISDRTGNGAMPENGQTVEVDYKATFLNGEVFDQTYDSGKTFQFKLGGHQVIKGFEEAVKMMKVGGKAKAIIPSASGYGENEVSNIPPFTTLIFEIELLKITGK